MNQIDRLLNIMQRLRDPESGCPWDKEQTFASIAAYTLEETYEVLDAIAREDFDDLRGELGDLLFQVVFYAQMAQEEGRFDFNDICAAISDKLERRHPHVFGELSADNSEEVLVRWEQIKTEERAQKAQYSALDDIPRSLPALMRAQKFRNGVQTLVLTGRRWDRLSIRSMKRSMRLCSRRGRQLLIRLNWRRKWAICSLPRSTWRAI